MLLDLALSLALGADCLADVGVLRGEPGVLGRVASDPTVSRTIAALAGDADRVLAAVAHTRAEARVWALAGSHAPDQNTDSEAPLIIDLDATLVTAHSDKEQAKPTFKRRFGFHPLCAFVDHGAEGTGEPLAVMLRAGNAGSNTAADHIAVTKAALAQLPGHPAGGPAGSEGAGPHRRCRRHPRLPGLATGRRLAYSVGFTLPGDIEPALAKIPASVWTPAYDADGHVRDGAFVAELTGLLDLYSWPKGMRVIARKGLILALSSAGPVS